LHRAAKWFRKIFRQKFLTPTGDCVAAAEPVTIVRECGRGKTDEKVSTKEKKSN